MATDKNIKQFTAVDIEKYHKGLLSQKEMHDLEKAALDDPFLADALEGYTTPGVNVATDMEYLKKRLSERVDNKKVIPLSTGRTNYYRFLRVAAMLVFVAGAAFLIYQFGFNNNNSNEIAQAEPTKNVEKSIPDSLSEAITTESEPSAEVKSILETKDEKNIITTNNNSSGGTIGNNNVKEKAISATPKNNAIVSVSPDISPAPSKNDDVSKKTGIVTEKKAIVLDEAKDLTKAKQENAEIITDDKITDKQLAGISKTNRAVAASKKAEEQNGINKAANIYRGRVTDENNVGVPFANVTNLNANTSTYTDANGYFSLNYPDSLLNVQISSIGFENNNVQLKNTTIDNTIVLQENQNKLSEVVVVGYNSKKRSAKKEESFKVEENEPIDGWGNYDLYLTNNIQLPKDYKSISDQKDIVQLSFEVNKKGQPINIKIEKSLCNSCDIEAIRLLKVGPKWIRNTKNSRTTVSIPF